MVGDQSIQRAVESGQRNADGFVMVKNWCAHVRIEKMGGIGMIEQMTGLPIGHHGLACDHASAEGMMCWNIRDAALDFYDRHCGKSPFGKSGMRESPEHERTHGEICHAA